MPTKKKTPSYAFWEYDLFPYVLSAAITKSKDKDGYVQVAGYDGFRIKPLRIIPSARGEVISRQLKELRIQHRAAIQATNKDFNAKALEVAPFLKQIFTK
jgi:hypothetical protein